LAKGHDVEMIGAFDESVGHAGMVTRHPDGLYEGVLTREATAWSRRF
jgi:hypothetical protein